MASCQVKEAMMCAYGIGQLLTDDVRGGNLGRVVVSEQISHPYKRVVYRASDDLFTVCGFS